MKPNQDEKIFGNKNSTKTWWFWYYSSLTYEVYLYDEYESSIIYIMLLLNTQYYMKQWIRQ